MTKDCRSVHPLIPVYLDGELDEDRARALRRHLIDCQPCRTAAQGERAQKRWFASEPAPAVPPGFAARVARRAFAGDLGRASDVEVLAPVVAAEGGQVFRFVLRATAAAAVLLIGLAGMLRNVDLPSGSDLRADDRTPPTLEELLRELDRLDAPAVNPPLEHAPASAAAARERHPAPEERR